MATEGESEEQNDNVQNLSSPQKTPQHPSTEAGIKEVASSSVTVVERQRVESVVVVDRPVPVIVDRPLPVPVDHVVYVQVDRVVEVEKFVPIPMMTTVEVPVPVERLCVVEVERLVEVPRELWIERPMLIDRPVAIPLPIPIVLGTQGLRARDLEVCMGRCLRRMMGRGVEWEADLLQRMAQRVQNDDWISPREMERLFRQWTRRRWNPSLMGSTPPEAGMQPLALEWDAERPSALGRRLASQVREMDTIQEEEQQDLTEDDQEVLSQPGIDCSPEKKKPQQVRIADWPEAWRLEYDAWLAEPNRQIRMQWWNRWDRELQENVFAVASTTRKQELREWQAESHQMSQDKGTEEDKEEKQEEEVRRSTRVKKLTLSYQSEVEEAKEKERKEKEKGKQRSRSSSSSSNRMAVPKEEEESHDWMEGERIGEASHPGPSLFRNHAPERSMQREKAPAGQRGVWAVPNRFFAGEFAKGISPGPTPGADHSGNLPVGSGVGEICSSAMIFFKPSCLGSAQGKPSKEPVQGSLVGILHKCTEQSDSEEEHDWKKGARIGEASNPGPWVWLPEPPATIDRPTVGRVGGRGRPPSYADVVRYGQSAREQLPPPPPYEQVVQRSTGFIKGKGGKGRKGW
jgi:hypothetical protein